MKENQNHPAWISVRKSLSCTYAKSEKYRKKINELTYWGKKIPNEVIDTTNELIKQINEIDSYLKPLENFGIYYSLLLGGGSVRDLLLGKHKEIKDLDLVIKIEDVLGDILFNNKILKKKFKEFRSFLLDTDELKEKFKNQKYTNNNEPLDHWANVYSKSNQKTRWKRKANSVVDKSMAYELLEIIFHKVGLLQTGFHPFAGIKEGVIDDVYISSRLSGVLKLNKEGWRWPIDVLVTKYSCRDYMKGFDFNICKAGVYVVKSYEREEQKSSALKSPEDFFKLIILDKKFLDDVLNKQITIHADWFNLNEIKKSCEVHYEKLKIKFPEKEWDLNIVLDETAYEYYPDDMNSSRKDFDEKKAYINYFKNKKILKEELNKAKSVKLNKI